MNLSGKRDSNSRPRPWQGRALPTELLPHATFQVTDSSLQIRSKTCSLESATWNFPKGTAKLNLIRKSANRGFRLSAKWFGVFSWLNLPLWTVFGDIENDS